MNIYGYGLEHFGELRASAYHETLANCFRLLADQPGLGRQHHITKQDVRVFFHESHAIVYQAGRAHILIVRVLSMRQNWQRILRTL